MQQFRVVMVLLAAVFAGYFVVLALATINSSGNASLTLTALAMYVVCAAVSLGGAITKHRISRWLAWLLLALMLVYVTLAMLQLDPHANNGYATWFIGASGVQLTVLMTRGQSAVAWVGIVLELVVLGVWLQSPLELLTSGVMGNIMWVLLAQLILRALRRAAHDATMLIAAEREASLWQAAQEAVLQERLVRLQQTERMAMPMLRLIEDNQGALSDAERQQCLVLEAGIRDEIRGRALLNQDIRAEVTRLRNDGIRVLLLDEGGLDALTDAARNSLLRQLHAVVLQVPHALGAGSQQLTVRTSPAQGRTITVVGVRGLLEHDDDLEVTLRRTIELSLESERPEAAGT